MHHYFCLNCTNCKFCNMVVINEIFHSDIAKKSTPNSTLRTLLKPTKVSCSRTGVNLVVFNAQMPKKLYRTDV